MIKILLFMSVAISTLLPATKASCAENYKLGVTHSKYESVYYPPNWRLLARNGAQDDPLAGGAVFYLKIPWYDPLRLPTDTGWATITVRRYNCKECYRGLKAGTIADFVDDKSCAKMKCMYHMTKCPVHTPETIPPSRLSSKCTKTSRYPMILGGICGRYYSREKRGDTYYYYFDGDTSAPDFAKDGGQLSEISAIFEKGGFIYDAELVCLKTELEQNLKTLNYVVLNLAVKTKK